MVESSEESLARLETVLNPLMKKSTGVSPTVDVKFPYKIPFLKKEAGFLVPEGDKQMYKIGERFAERFPELLSGRFSISDFNFTSSCRARSTQSTTAFGMGYLKGKGSVTKLNLQPIPLTSFPCNNDRLHNILKGCPNFEGKIKRNKGLFAEAVKFLESRKFQVILEKVRRKLGLTGVKEVNENVLLSMFRACSWSVQAFGDFEDSGWCSLFNSEDQKVYDYYVDLFNYYAAGPANQDTTDGSCVLLQDIISNLEMASVKVAKGRQLKLIARIGHVRTIGWPLTKLGLFLDKIPLKADNYESMRNRGFKIGKVAPMSGNFAFVLYKCHYGQYKIQFYLNERLLKLPACHSKIYCSLRQFLNYYKASIDICARRYDEIC